MDTLIAISYPDLDAARRAIAELESLRDSKVMGLQAVAIVECALDGQLRSHVVEPGHVPGAPLLGSMIERVESSLDAGRDRDDDDMLIDRIARKARHDSVSLGFVTTDLDIYRLSAGLAGFGGYVIDTTLSLDDELKLVEAISKGRDPDDRPTD
ncbi:hypothetical protein [Burkholderia ambifaria]|uniref:hypothetical protein n=1 Tax=Burkholderia ambifaria TaxID=152480 RepID=UPI00158D7493|nr:hypothetical protein [Burkholderia ambifaria]